MSYYDGIAKKWHEITGFRGGAFKRLVLNGFLLDRIPDIAGWAILELGAGNGYFMPMVLERFSGQTPERFVITDMSSKLLHIAQRSFRIPEAEYRQVDVRAGFPFDSGSFDLILATMVFNEVSDSAMKKALSECRRVLGETGTLLLTVTHPRFVESLHRRGETRQDRNGLLTMPAADGIRLPIFRRSQERYEAMLRRAGFMFESHDVHALPEVLREKPGLRSAGNVPLALVFRCRIAR